MTVYKPIEKLAKSAAECAVAMAKGETVVTEETLNDGTTDVPYIKLQPLAVTKGNIDATIIDSGFHLREDVYIERPKVQQDKIAFEKKCRQKNTNTCSALL